jgi:hypothetical protein
MYRITVAVPVHEYKDDIHHLTDILNDTYFLGCVQGHFDLKRDAGQFVVTFERRHADDSVKNQHRRKVEQLVHELKKSRHDEFLSPILQALLHPSQAANLQY